MAPVSYSTGLFIDTYITGSLGNVQLLLNINTPI